jgi:integrase
MPDGSARCQFCATRPLRTCGQLRTVAGTTDAGPVCACCLSDDSMPLDLRVGGALILLFGLLVSRVMQLTKNDVVDDGGVTYLEINTHRLMLPPQLACLVRQFRDQNDERWTLASLGTPAPWLFPGQSPARPAVDVLFGVRLQRHGINAHAGRNTARLALCR